jgi:hypothetical protein
MESKHCGAGAGAGAGFGAKAAAKDHTYNDADDKEERSSPKPRDPSPEPKAVPNHHHVGSKGEGRSHKHTALEADLDDEVDREFEALKLKPNVGQSAVSADPMARKIAQGLRINFMNMRDAATGKLIWESERFRNDTFGGEMEGFMECLYFSMFVDHLPSILQNRFLNQF